MTVRLLSVCMTAVITMAAAVHVPVHAAPQGGDTRELAKAQVEFGIRVAQRKLWREAAYRFEKAVEADPSYAAAWNNLAIAFEEQGRFPDADQAYKKAVQLEPDNILIRQNYDLFKEIYDRISARSRR